MSDVQQWLKGSFHWTQKPQETAALSAVTSTIQNHVEGTFKGHEPAKHSQETEETQEIVHLDSEGCPGDLWTCDQTTAILSQLIPGRDRQFTTSKRTVEHKELDNHHKREKQDWSHTQFRYSLQQCAHLCLWQTPYIRSQRKINCSTLT